MIFDIEKSGEVSWMINKQATAYMAILLPDYDDENFGKTYQVIVSFPDHLNQHQNDPKYEHLPTGLYAYTTVQTEFHLLYDHIRLAQKKIKRDGYTIHGRIIVEINSSADLYTLYMPVRK